MNLKFFGETESVQEGLKILAAEYDVALGSGIPVEVKNQTGGIHVSFDGEKAVIHYEKKIHFFRAFGLLAEHLQAGEESFSLQETPYFQTTGIMLDTSRNAVPTVDTIHLYIRKMAIMGINMLSLYMEDTFEVADLPYFGYMRGRYTFEELKACDEYADIFGIEVIPFIQTLAHLSRVTKWDWASEITDCADILLVDEEKTYEVIEKLIMAAKAPFRTNRMAIGFDEAWNIGSGKYFAKHGYQSKADILRQHLDQVMKITEKYGLIPMIYDDMFMKELSEGRLHLDLQLEVTEADKGLLPEGIQLIMWDYFHMKEQEYSILIQQRQTICDNLMCMGAWFGFATMAPNYKRTFSTNQALLTASKQMGVKEMCLSLWNDGGGEANLLSSFLAAQLYAENTYARDVSMDKLHRRFRFCMGADGEDFYNLTYFDDIITTEYENTYAFEPCNPSRFILWQDILLGLHDKNLSGKQVGQFYGELKAKIDLAARNNPAFEAMFMYYADLADVLCVKSEIGVELKTAYDARDLERLKKAADETLVQLSEKIRKLHKSHCTLWHSINKSFGWEVLDIRYGGLLLRIDTAINKINGYLSGALSKIEELEEDRLLSNRARGMYNAEGTFGRHYSYAEIATPGYMLTNSI